jgi:hypothetical protein
MSDPDTETPTPSEQRARDALHALSSPAADDSFRARLREQFVGGRFEAAPARVVRLRWHERPMTRWTLAAAAAALAAISALALNQGPAWRIASLHGTGVAYVDERPVTLGGHDDLGQFARPGAHVILPPDADLELRAGTELWMQVAAGSEVVIPTVPGRWFARRVHGEVRAGEVRLTTGDSFHGASLAMTTPEAHVNVTGTTLAVICEPQGTCVCVLEGAVRVGARPDSMAMVPQGMRAYVFADGRPMERDLLRPDEAPKLSALRAARLERTAAAGR